MKIEISQIEKKRSVGEEFLSFWESCWSHMTTIVSGGVIQGFKKVM